MAAILPIAAQNPAPPGTEKPRLGQESPSRLAGPPQLPSRQLSPPYSEPGITNQLLDSSLTASNRLSTAVATNSTGTASNTVSVAEQEAAAAEAQKTRERQIEHEKKLGIAKDSGQISITYPNGRKVTKSADSEK